MTEYSFCSNAFDFADFIQDDSGSTSVLAQTFEGKGDPNEKVCLILDLSAWVKLAVRVTLLITLEGDLSLCELYFLVLVLRNCPSKLHFKTDLFQGRCDYVMYFHNFAADLGRSKMDLKCVLL